MSEFGENSSTDDRDSEYSSRNIDAVILGGLEDLTISDDIVGNESGEKSSNSNEVDQAAASFNEKTLANGSSNANQTPRNKLEVTDRVFSRHRSYTIDTCPDSTRNAIDVVTNGLLTETDLPSLESNMVREYLCETIYSNEAELSSDGVVTDGNDKSSVGSSERDVVFEGSLSSSRISPVSYPISSEGDLSDRPSLVQQESSDDEYYDAIGVATSSCSSVYQSLHSTSGQGIGLDQLTQKNSESDSSFRSCNSESIWDDDDGPNTTLPVYTCKIIGKVRISIEKGELCKLSPFVSALREDKFESHCSFCFKALEEEVRVRCRVCHCLVYCNSTCQDSDWPVHRFECNHLEWIRGNKYARCVARMYWKLTKANGQQETCNVLNETIKLGNLAHTPDSMQSEKYLTKMILCYSLLESLEQWTLPLSDFEILYAKFMKHAMVISDLEGDLGIGMYFGLAAFKHSCVPTTNFVFVGNTMQIFAPCAIDRRSKITLRFVDIFKIKRKHYDDLRPINGGICDCDNLDVEPSRGLWHEIIPDAMNSEYMQHVLGVVKALKGGEIPAEDLRHTLIGMSDFLGDNNMRRVEILAKAAAYSRRLNLHAEEIYCLAQLEEIYKEILGSFDTMTIQVTYQLAIVQAKNGDTTTAVPIFEEAIQNSIGAYGNNDITEKIKLRCMEEKRIQLESFCLEGSDILESNDDPERSDSRSCL